MSNRPQRSELPTAVLISAALVMLYFSGYAWARMTHRLVWYGYAVARPHAGTGFGMSDWELLFMPACWAEETLRNFRWHRQ